MLQEEGRNNGGMEQVLHATKTQTDTYTDTHTKTIAA